MKQEINIVWLKRDLRSQDHLPFFNAELEETPYLPIYIFEPSIIHHPDCSLRHLQFQFHSIQNLLPKIKNEIHLFYGEALDVFTYLNDIFHIKNIFSYQESGIQITYERDKQIAKFAKKYNISWHEFQRDGIVRGLKKRENWSAKWYQALNKPIVINTYKLSIIKKFTHPFPIPNALMKKLKLYPDKFQPAGEDYAMQYLSSFLTNRMFNYSYDIGKPLESRKSCSRLSPFLSWGNLSLKQVYQAAKNKQVSKNHHFHLKNFMSRLRWNNHFIQKFEMDSGYEYSFLNKGYLQFPFVYDKKLIQKWENAETGIPIIDANILCLKATGWINFRSRAMLVSFLTHHLQIDWRNGAYFLARNFLDYEPGIHYPQLQMQAGTTGINTLRIYNPIKQSKEKDPEGAFIKQWIPALKNIPTAFIHEPYKMSQLEKEMHGIQDIEYPKPIIDLELSSKLVREKLWKFKKSIEVKMHKPAILEKHVENS